MSRATIPAAPIAFDGWSGHFDSYAPDYEETAFSGAGLAFIGRREVDAVTRALGTNPRACWMPAAERSDTRSSTGPVGK